MTIPTILAKPRTDHIEGWQFYCRYCRRNHLHGEGLGHRQAHCSDPNSPYKLSGYILTDQPQEATQ